MIFSHDIKDHEKIKDPISENPPSFIPIGNPCTIITLIVLALSPFFGL